MLYDILHTTTYDYRAEVLISQQVLRLAPRELTRQRCQQYELRIQPQPSEVSWFVDYFGNRATFLTLESPHSQFQVHARSRVEVLPQNVPNAYATPTWEAVRDNCSSLSGAEAIETGDFLYDSPLVHRRHCFLEFAQPSFTPGRPLLDAVLDLTQRIYNDFKFDGSATTVATPLEEVLRVRRGVCQDFTHLQIACLRSLGLPARYVSGYLETTPPPNQPRLVGVDASHAWTSFYCPGHGWIDVDPTNNLLPMDKHVTLGWGRDYSDISPVRGVILGTGDHSLRVAVDVMPVAPAPSSVNPRIL